MVSLEYLDYDGVIPFAHRGGSVRYPENTLAAFAFAIGLGYRYLETDVHASCDGVLFAFHDPDLTRMTSTGGEISQMSSSEIARVRIVDSQGEKYGIPRLDDLVATWPHCRFNIDVKSDTAVAPLIAFIDKNKLLNRVCIGSFSLKRLRACRQALGPELCTSMAPSEVGRLVAASRGPVPAPTAAACAQVPLHMRGIPVITERLVDFAHSLGIPVHVWTINDPTTMGSLVEREIDGIMTDEVITLLDVLDHQI